MPTNLPPEYFDIERRYRAAGSPQEKITCLEEMLSIIPKHKGTDKLRADYRKRLSKLKSASQSKKGVSKQVSPYHIDKEGAGQVVIVGPPNVGKSALVATLTNADPEVANFPYTTWGPTPGMMKFEDIQVQLIDTPPLSNEYIEPELLNMIRRAELVLLMLDLQAYPIQQLEDTTALLEKHRIIPAHWRDRYTETRRLTFIPMVVLVNKVDDAEWDEDFAVLRELFEDDWFMLSISMSTERNLDHMKRMIFDKLEIVRVYSKPPGKDPNLAAPFVMKKGGTVEEFAGKVHKDFLRDLKSARVWGSAEHDGLMVGRDYVLQDEDVVELRT